MDNRTIGVFDSGLGGLTSVRELIHALPGESVVYFGDTGRVPYGSRSNQTIIRYVREDIRFLLTFDIKLILVACGTASSVALPQIGACPVPVIGVVEPAVSSALAATQNGRIGVIGTSGTINSGMYERLLTEQNPNLKIYSNACPLFVPLVENGMADEKIASLAVEQYLAPLKDKGIDTLILGCTHYPLLSGAIRRYLGEEVTLIDPGCETARYVRDFLTANDMLSDRTQGEQRYYVSDSIENFSKNAGAFLHEEIRQQIQKIEIERYGIETSCDGKECK